MSIASYGFAQMGCSFLKHWGDGKGRQVGPPRLTLLRGISQRSEIRDVSPNKSNLRWGGPAVDLLKFIASRNLRWWVGWWVSKCESGEFSAYR